MKEARVLMRGVSRVVYEDQVDAAVQAMRQSAAVSQNDKVLLGSIVDDWKAAHMMERKDKLVEQMLRGGTVE